MIVEGTDGVVIVVEGIVLDEAGMVFVNDW